MNNKSEISFIEEEQVVFPLALRANSA